MADEAVMDVSTEAADGLDTDNGIGDVDAGDGTGADGAATGAEDESGVAAESDSTPVVIDPNGALKLSAKAKVELDAIKAKDAGLAKQIRASLFDSAALRQQFPEGVKEAIAIKDAFEALGGEDGVQQLKGTVDAWEALDKDFQAADPKFVEDIAAGNPDAFLKLAPSVFHKFSEMNPEGFSAYASKIFAGDMQAHNIPLTMLRMKDLIGENKPAMDLWNSLAGYMDRISDNAAKPINAAAKPGKTDETGLNEREQRIADQEKSQITRDWQSDREKTLTTIETSEFTRLSAGRKLTDTQKGAIKELFDSRLRKMLNADTDYKKKIDRFFAAKDKTGYSRHVQSAYKQKVPLAMKAAFDAVMPGKPGPTKKIEPGAKPAVNGKPAEAPQGWTRVSVKPAMWDVNHAKRTPQMVRDGKFPMKDGRLLLYSKA